MRSNTVNLADYPLDRPESTDYRALVERCAAMLKASGMLNLERFLTPEGTERLAGQVDDLMPEAHHSAREDTAYGVPPDDDMAADHPYRILSRTDRFGIAYHQMRGTALDELYVWPPLRQFVADVTGHPTLYLHDDPSNALVLQIYKTHGGLAWHFDQATFSTILNLRESEAGGAFECVPNIRTEDDPAYDAVREVLLGTSERVERRFAKPGSFTIILGRHTLHRVATIEGPTARISLVLSYEDRPGMRMDPARRRKLFGPTAPMDP